MITGEKPRGGGLNPKKCLRKPLSSLLSFRSTRRYYAPHEDRIESHDHGTGARERKRTDERGRRGLRGGAELQEKIGVDKGALCVGAQARDFNVPSGLKFFSSYLHLGQDFRHAG